MVAFPDGQNINTWGHHRLHEGASGENQQFATRNRGELDRVERDWPLQGSQTKRALSEKLTKGMVYLLNYALRYPLKF